MLQGRFLESKSPRKDLRHERVGVDSRLVREGLGDDGYAMTEAWMRFGW